MATADDYERLGGWAAVKNADAGVDRRGATRTVPMRVLNVGFCRTGTMSMQKAYSILGLAHPYHFSRLFENVRDIDLWLEAFQAKERAHGVMVAAEWRERFDQLLGHCSAVADAPSICFYPELMAAYPDAKVVLVERDAAAWERSFLPVLDVLHPVGYLFRLADPAFSGRFARLNPYWVQHLVGTANVPAARATAKAAYLEYNRTVRATVPPDRLLVYKLGSGWEPLCAFLDCPVPEHPFPHLNESKALEEGIKIYFARAFKNAFINISLFVGMVAVVGGVVWPRVKASM